MDRLTVMLFFSALVGNSLEDDITASSAEVFSSEGRAVTLSCNYSVKANNLQWYRQDPGSAPQYLLLITVAKEPEVVRAKPPDLRLTAELNEDTPHHPLEGVTHFSCEELTPVKTEEFSPEGSSVTLSYTYLRTGAGDDDSFFWHRQYPGKPGEFLISHLVSDTKLKQEMSGLSIKVSGDKSQMDLQISSAAVTHSALYYCAVRPTVTANTQCLYNNTS
ncbi:uncharacterized protein [Trachinotus anak]|uniref:uncharacterized protein n=1 Tax=Trachinotus anak TaxID=443729 RepID=UPI0039F1D9FE